MANVSVAGLSNDIRFILAYDAAERFINVVRAEDTDSSVVTLQHLHRAAGPTQRLQPVVVFNNCRMLRNQIEYRLPGVSRWRCDQLVKRSRNCRGCRSVITARHPHLA